KLGDPPEEAAKGTKAVGKGAHFRCIFSDAPISGKSIMNEGCAGRIGSRMMAIVVDSAQGRLYLDPIPSHEDTAKQAKQSWKPDIEFDQRALGFRVGNYGLTKWSDLFTARQLTALTTYSDLISDAFAKIQADAIAHGLSDDGRGLDDGGDGATAYAQAVGVYLAFALDKMADLGNSLCRWEPNAQCPRQLFGRQAIPMIWSFAEGNMLGSSSGAWSVVIDGMFRALSKTFDSVPTWFKGTAAQLYAQSQTIGADKLISTDPPYYDNIGYADLSDFFYVWLRRSLKQAFPGLFATLAAPKDGELVATPFRHGGKDRAAAFFMDGMTNALCGIVGRAHPAFPTTLYYAFKESESTDAGGVSSTGWETFLQALLDSGISVVGTWPMRTENASRMRGQNSNALASSIVLVCRKRPSDASVTSRRVFVREIAATLPGALDDMTHGEDRSPIAPVDLSQAIIGPGMAVFSRYSRVLRPEGTPIKVREALQLINRFLAEEDFDHDTQFSLNWFTQYGWEEGPFGAADVLARSKSTSVAGVVEAGVVQSRGGKVRMLRINEYPKNWDPQKDDRIPIWKMLQQLTRILRDVGEEEAAALLLITGNKSDAIRQLAYRLHTLCERMGLADDARWYNELITSWFAVERAARRLAVSDAQLDYFKEDL
ncbi:MAG: hypothetical protein FWD57_05285, partial [Polyangiaceae bacterium]|nr:hypothetical protein [Polyangiaceae bacterium]